MSTYSKVQADETKRIKLISSPFCNLNIDLHPITYSPESQLTDQTFSVNQDEPHWERSWLTLNHIGSYHCSNRKCQGLSEDWYFSLGAKVFLQNTKDQHLQPSFSISLSSSLSQLIRDALLEEEFQQKSLLSSSLSPSSWVCALIL